MSIIQEICVAIKHNPKINRVLVSRSELELIRCELENLSPIGPSPKPTYGAPYGDIDRFFWNELQGVLKNRTISILGRPVEASP